MLIARERFSFERIQLASKTIDPVFLNTPQYECESLSLSLALGVTLILKIETVNPIRSFKGRGADFLLSQLDNRKQLVCASAGNFGQAMAYACRKRQRKLIVYASKNANPFKLERMRALGAEVILAGEDFDAAKEEAKRAANEDGCQMIEDALAPETVEGAGTIGLELLAAGRFDILLVALGNGALFNGIATVFKTMSPETKMIAVQAAGAPAMAESWKSKKLVTYPRVQTIADGIGVRIPIPEALADMEFLADDVLTVSEEGIIRAMKLLHVHAGIVAEPSAAVGVAAVLEDQKQFVGKRLATIICGGNLTETQLTEWLQ